MKLYCIQLHRVQIKRKKIINRKASYYTNVFPSHHPSRPLALPGAPWPHSDPARPSWSTSVYLGTRPQCSALETAEREARLEGISQDEEWKEGLEEINGVLVDYPMQFLRKEDLGRVVTAISAVAEPCLT